MRPFQFLKSSTPQEARTKKTANTAYLAGGTNLVDLLKKHIAQPERIIDINDSLPQTITETKTGIQIGAMVRNSVLTTHPVIKAQFPLLAQAILAGASQQIRNMASTGGNLMQRTRCPYFYDTTTPCNKRQPGSGCSALTGNQRLSAIVGYSNQCVAVHPSDMCVALAAYNATVNVQTASGQFTKINFADFHRLPEAQPELDNTLPTNALIHSIDVATNNFTHTAYVKLRDRNSYAFALVSVAAALTIKNNRITDARLASGGVAHKPWRWFDAEKYLIGKQPTTQHFEAAAQKIIATVKPLPSNAFKVPLLQGAVVTALQQCLEKKL